MSPSDRIWSLAQAVREAAPLIHNLSNLVVQADTAAAIASLGGVQITLHNEEEAEDAARAAAALVVNPGTLNAGWLRAAHRAIAVATEQGRPWLLDPVAVGFSDYRRQAVQALLAYRPKVLKGNASEILVLAGEAVGGRGADSLHTVEQAMEGAQRLAREHGCIVVVTGEKDAVCDGGRLLRLPYGRRLMGAMVGSGCMLGAVIACFLAASEDAFEAATAAIVWFNIAGERAADGAAGPGTLKPRLIDALYSLDSKTLSARLAGARWSEA